MLPVVDIDLLTRKPVRTKKPVRRTATRNARGATRTPLRKHRLSFNLAFNFYAAAALLAVTACVLWPLLRAPLLPNVFAADGLPHLTTTVAQHFAQPSDAYAAYFPFYLLATALMAFAAAHNKLPIVAALLPILSAQAAYASPRMAALTAACTLTLNLRRYAVLACGLLALLNVQSFGMPAMPHWTALVADPYGLNTTPYGAVYAGFVGLCLLPGLPKINGRMLLCAICVLPVSPAAALIAVVVACSRSGSSAAAPLALIVTACAGFVFAYGAPIRLQVHRTAATAARHPMVQAQPAAYVFQPQGMRAHPERYGTLPFIAAALKMRLHDAGTLDAAYSGPMPWQHLPAELYGMRFPVFKLGNIGALPHSGDAGYKTMMNAGGVQLRVPL